MYLILLNIIIPLTKIIINKSIKIHKNIKIIRKKFVRLLKKSIESISL